MLGRRLLIAVTAALAGLSACRGCGKQSLPLPAPTPAAPTATAASVGLAAPSPTPHYIVAFGWAEPDSGPAPLTVKFEFLDPFRNIDEPELEWDFGDGSPKSTKKNPLHVYEKPGKYVAHMKVVDSGGADDDDDVEIEVEEPVANAPGTPSPQP